MEPDAQRLRQILRDARATARLSQLALALRLNVSQRHLSFVESGRALPSRGLLLAWLEELHVPLVARNEALQSAGYAPSFASRALGDADLAQATDAVRRLLATHDPMPAWVVDADWNVLNANRGAQWLVGLLLPPSLPSSPPSHAPLNMLDLMTAPEGITARIVNLHEVAHPMLAQLRAEAAVHPALTPKVEALRALLRQRLGADLPLRDEVRRAAPVLTTRFATPFGVLSFFTMLTTFGTPHDITLASLRIEHLFAADETTAAVVTAQVGATG